MLYICQKYIFTITIMSWSLFKKTQGSKPKLSKQKFWEEIKSHILNIYKYFHAAWASYLRQSIWYGKGSNMWVFTVRSFINALKMCHAVLFQISNTSPSIRFHIYHIIARYTTHGRLPLNDRKNICKCKQDSVSEKSTKIYTRKELVMMKKKISNFRTSFYIP